MYLLDTNILSELIKAHPKALKAAEILNRLYSLGNPIGMEDVMIGATGLANGLTVVTGNTKHFLSIEGLTVENWLI